MILTCPECATRFIVPDDALRPKGRTVKCGKCQHQWHVDAPPAAEGTDADALAAAVAAEEPGYEPVRVTPLDPDEQAPFRPRNLPAVARPAPRGATVAAWGLLVTMVVALGSVLWFGRAQLATVMPAVQPLYEAVGLCAGVANPETSFRLVGDTKPVLEDSKTLVVKQKVERINHCASYVPDVIVEFRDTGKRVLQRSRYPLGLASLETGKATPFTLKITEWPANAPDFKILFTIPNVQG